MTTTEESVSAGTRQSSAPAGGQISPWSDTIAGYVEEYDRSTRHLRLTSLAGTPVEMDVDPGAGAELIRNLGHPYQDSGELEDLLEPGRLLLAYGISYPGDPGPTFVAMHLYFLGRRADGYAFEDQRWWIDQVGQLAGFYQRAEFGAEPADFRDYRTILRLGGDKTENHTQETDTISRLVYGMASAYMLTGNETYLDTAERGTEYLRRHMRFVDNDEEVTYWYHGVRFEDGYEKKLFTSEFGDDYDAIPMYEQIYALAGPIQTFRVTGDPRIHADAEGTLRLFEKFFRDREQGGYFSHIDPIQLSPFTDSLGPNRARKNWNSVGDHAPAYLINLFLATGDRRHITMLERTFDTIAEHFPDYEYSPFVNERFHQDWSHDLSYSWQQDRAVVGHNLKIAWNLMRMHSLQPKERYEELARHIGDLMPQVGCDLQRGGWYDVVHRVPDEAGWHRMAWHDRKAWWQQEQAILAYLILAGLTGEDRYRKLARESEAFYNTFFLDHDEGAVYFNVLASGLPYLQGTERFKGSHSMSMYHSAELCFLAAVYNNLLLRGRPLDLWFKPYAEADRTLRVTPDALPPGSVRISAVTIDGVQYDGFDAAALTVTLPESPDRLTVKVTLVPTGGDDD
ncbi:hypothetical protein GCM10027059_13960 [Myceligenerans halotolerans]